MSEYSKPPSGLATADPQLQFCNALQSVTVDPDRLQDVLAAGAQFANLPPLKLDLSILRPMPAPPDSVLLHQLAGLIAERHSEPDAYERALQTATAIAAKGTAAIEQAIAELQTPEPQSTHTTPPATHPQNTPQNGSKPPVPSPASPGATPTATTPDAPSATPVGSFTEEVLAEFRGLVAYRYGVEHPDDLKAAPNVAKKFVQTCLDAGQVELDLKKCREWLANHNATAASTPAPPVIGRVELADAQRQPLVEHALWAWNQSLDDHDLRYDVEHKRWPGRLLALYTVGTLRCTDPQVLQEAGRRLELPLEALGRAFEQVMQDRTTPLKEPWLYPFFIAGQLRRRLEAPAVETPRQWLRVEELAWVLQRLTRLLLKATQKGRSSVDVAHNYFLNKATVADYHRDTGFRLNDDKLRTMLNVLERHELIRRENHCNRTVGNYNRFGSTTYWFGPRPLELPEAITAWYARPTPVLHHQQ